MNSYFLCTVLIVCVLRVSPTSQQDDSSPIVDTLLGNIKGSTLTTQYGAVIYSFRGIPYAQPPIDNLRFSPPEPVSPWSDTLSATRDSLVCPQPGVQLLMSEDCLKLNVFSRNLTGKAPVMVYIHGGANVLGSGHSLYEAGPQYLLDHDVVLVAFNYRLGALGFLSTGTKEAPGNYGYLDQVLALKWVQQHVSNFGGDPELVTLFGLSAGSMAVTLHMASPLSQGLFHRAIGMSGSATNHFSIDNLAWTRKLARETSCPIYNPQSVVDCLRTVSWGTIVNVCSNWEPYGLTNMKWNYEIDGNFLLAHPTEVFLKGNFNRVPLLVGFTKNELDFSVFHQQNNTGLLNDFSLSFDQYAPEIFLYNGTAELQNPPISRRIQQFYFDNQTDITKENLITFGEIFSDSIIGHGVHRLVEMVHPSTHVFYYRMDYVGRRSLYALDTEGKPRGVGHADDIQYIMPGLWYGTQFKLDDPDMFMVDRMTKWWTTFAKYGAPMPEYEGQWEPSALNEVKILYIEQETHMEEGPNKERYALWDAMFPKEASAAATINIRTLSVALIGIIMSAVNNLS